MTRADLREPRYVASLSADTPPVPRLFGPARRARLAIIALFLGVTGTTAAVAMGFSHPHTALADTSVYDAAGRPVDLATAASTAEVRTLVARQQDLAVRQYGVLALASNAHSSTRITAAAEALQVTLKPLVARAPLDQVALNAARQILTGERAILSAPANIGDPQVSALLAQTEGLLAQLPPVSNPVTVAAPTAPVVVSTPTATATTNPDPSQAPTDAPSDTPTAPPASDSVTPAPQDSPTDQDTDNSLLGPLVSTSPATS